MSDSRPEVHYVAGLMFNLDRTEVALIRKLKPAFQKGRLNGVGGKLEPGESPITAMVREFAEETGHSSEESSWGKPFLSLVEKDDSGRFRYQVDFFSTCGDLSQLRSMEAEQLEIVPLASIHPLRGDLVEGLAFAVSLALDNLNTGRPRFVLAEYR